MVLCVSLQRAGLCREAAGPRDGARDETAQGRPARGVGLVWVLACVVKCVVL